MTDIAKIALEFCRECLGWKNANITYGSDGVIWNGEVKEHIKGFHFTDLNAVMEAVKGWCEHEHLDLYLQYFCIARIYRGKVIGQDADGIMLKEMSFEDHYNPCHALLLACIEASRKMQAGVA